MKKLYLINKADQDLRKFVAAYNIQDAICTYRITMGYDPVIESIELFIYENEPAEVII